MRFTANTTKILAAVARTLQLTADAMPRFLVKLAVHHSVKKVRILQTVLRIAIPTNLCKWHVLQLLVSIINTELVPLKQFLSAVLLRIAVTIRNATRLRAAVLANLTADNLIQFYGKVVRITCDLSPILLAF